MPHRHTRLLVNQRRRFETWEHGARSLLMIPPRSYLIDYGQTELCRSVNKHRSPQGRRHHRHPQSTTCASRDPLSVRNTESLDLVKFRALADIRQRHLILCLAQMVSTLPTFSLQISVFGRRALWRLYALFPSTQNLPHL
jgi:hypothetical protein